MFVKKKKFFLVSLVSTPKTSKRKDHQFEYNGYSSILKFQFYILPQANYLLICKFILNFIKKFSSILLFSNKVKFFYRILLVVITILLNIVIFIYVFTSCERKILALTQRRIRPRVVGARGRLQFIADVVKLLTKVNASRKKLI